MDVQIQRLPKQVIDAVGKDETLLAVLLTVRHVYA